VEVPDGFVANPANDRSNVTFGLFWQPIPQLAFKLDYLDADNDDHSAVDLLRFSMGYIF
jgi:phosphate-selective porin